MAPGDPDSSLSPIGYDVKRNMHSRTGEHSDVEDLKESLKDGLMDTRRKMTLLRKELKEKQMDLEKEQSLRQRAEQELAQLSTMNGQHDRNHTTPPSPATLRSRLLQSPNRSKSPGNIESILHELRSARMLNRTLTERLSQAEQDFEQAIQSKEDMKLELEASVAARGAALVDKIYTAQRERDTAVLQRLKTLSDDKEDLLKKLKRLEKDHACDSGVETGSLFGDEQQQQQQQYTDADHLSLNEIVDRVTSSRQSRAIEFHGDVIVDRLNRVQDSQKRQSAEEFQTMREERDMARKEMEQLREQLRELNEEYTNMETQHRKNEKNRLKAMQEKGTSQDVDVKNQNQLRGVIEERDEALEKNQQFEDQLQQFKLQHSLKNSLSQEVTLREQFNDTLDKFDRKLNEKETILSCTQQSFDDVRAKLEEVTREKTTLQTRLDEVQRQADEHRKRADRLERLLAVRNKRKNTSVSDNL